MKRELSVTSFETDARFKELMNALNEHKVLSNGHKVALHATFINEYLDKGYKASDIASFLGINRVVLYMTIHAGIILETKPTWATDDLNITKIGKIWKLWEKGGNDAVKAMLDGFGTEFLQDLSVRQIDGAVKELLLESREEDMEDEDVEGSINGDHEVSETTEGVLSGDRQDPGVSVWAVEYLSQLTVGTELDQEDVKQIGQIIRYLKKL